MISSLKSALLSRSTVKLTPHFPLPAFERFRQELRGEMYTDALSLGLYATDASMYQIPPLMVAVPRDRADALRAVRLCGELGLPVLARGGGTSLTGQSVGEAVILDVSKHLNHLLELNLDEDWVRVEPGMVCSELNTLLRPHGVQFAPDPATANRANIGGMIANNAAGMRSIRYGMTIDHVLALDLALATGEVLSLGPLDAEQLAVKRALPDQEGMIYRGLHDLVIHHAGEIRDRYPKVMRRSGGYALDALVDADPWNPARLICGSEGTLGVILEAKLRLTPLPRQSAVCLAHFDSLDASLRAAALIVAEGPSAVELIDGVILRQAQAHPLTRDACAQIQGDPGSVLVIEVQGDDPAAVITHIHRIADGLSGAAYAAPVMIEPQAVQQVWQLRSSALGLLTTVPGTKKPVPYIEDAAVPIEVLADYVAEVLAVCRKYDQPVSMFGHASVGLIHIRPLHDLHQDTDIARMAQIQEEIFPLVRKYGGSWSGEHGDGIVRGGYNRRFFGDVLYGAFQEVKQLFDPKGRMNPGKVIDAPPMDSHLRFGSGYQPLMVQSGFHYRAQGGMLAAAEQCSGVGACRKTQTGVMCPSYAATRDEVHSTRGRANALRLALTGQLGPEALSSDELRAVMDLCLGCKGCKGECPGSVDMTRMKSDVLYQHQLRHGTPLRARLFGSLPALAALAAGPQAHVVNRMLKNRVVRHLMKDWLGIDSRRPLPMFASQRLSTWYRRRGGARGAGKRVVLFNDTYTEHYLPQVGQAVIEVLEAAGYRAELVTLGDSQRGALSQGLLVKARRQGARLFQRLAPLLGQDTPLLVCEPSCASALADDLPDLVADAELGQRIASRVRMVDTFLEQELAAERCQLPWRLSNQPVHFLVHGHCHQKTLDGGKHTLNLLARIPGAVVAESEAGCCGMAGAFGYEKEHAELSRRIASERLMPRLQAASAETRIVSNGFSCRHQISDLSGRQAVHAMEALRGFITVPYTSHTS